MSTDLFKTYITDLFKKKYTTEDFVLDENFRKIIEGERGTYHLLEDLKEEFPEKIDEINLAMKILKGLDSGKYRHTTDRKNELWDQLVLQQRRQIRLKVFQYAAVFLILIGIGSASLYIFNQRSSVERFAASTEVNINDAALILHNGKQIVISSHQSNIQYTPDGAGVSVNDTIKIEQPVTGNGVNQMIVPFGKRSSVILSDGTKVWLNSGSRLVYSPAFKGKSREVYLEGEAYFEVIRDADKPFYVKTDEYNIKVYGTKFNVSAHKEDNEFNTILVEGKVSLNINGQSHSKEVFLAPRQRASLSKEHDNFQITEVDNIENYVAWVNGYLTFENEDISDVLKKVSKYYNINIAFSHKTNTTKMFSGKLDLKDNPEQVMDALAIISKSKCVKQENEYVFISR